MTGATQVSGFSRAKQSVDQHILEALKERAEAAGHDPENVPALDHWTFHDLRRTLATGLQKLGVKLEVIGAVLIHIYGSQSGSSASSSATSMRPKSALPWTRGPALEAIVSGEADQKVCRFRAEVEPSQTIVDNSRHAA
jgi:hypothetical protein